MFDDSSSNTPRHQGELDDLLSTIVPRGPALDEAARCQKHQIASLFIVIVPAGKVLGTLENCKQHLQFRARSSSACWGLSCSLGAVVQLGSCRADSRQRQRTPLQAPYARPARPPPPNEQPVAEGDGLRVRSSVYISSYKELNPSKSQFCLGHSPRNADGK